MSGLGDHEPIEIELTSHEPTGDGVRSPMLPLAAEPVVAESSDEPAPRRRHGTLAVAAAALAALVVGVLIGRLGGENSVASTASTVERSTMPAATPTTTDPAFAALDTLPPVPAPTTTRAPRVVEAGPVESPAVGESVEIGLHDAVAGLPIEIVATRWSGTTAIVDLSTATQRSIEIGPRSDGVSQMVAGRGWTAFVSFDWQQGVRIVRDNGTEIDVRQTGQPVLRSEDSDGLWVSLNPYGPFDVEMIEIDGFGVPTGRSVPSDGGFPVAADPRGGLVVRGVGGDYSVSEAGAVLLTRGELLGIGADTLLAQECDELRQCSIVVIDRSSGERSTVDVGIDVAASTYFGPFGAGVPALSPDETYAIVFSQADSAFPDTWVPPSAYLLNVRTGSAMLMGDLEGSPSVRWSPEGRFVFWVNRSSLEAFGVESGESVRVSDALFEIGPFDIRPTLPSVDPGSQAPTTSTAPIEP